MMPVQALVLVPLAIRVDDFSGAARTRASYWAVGNSLLTNSWTSHEEEEETDTLVTMPSGLRAAPQRLPGQSRLPHAFD